jgi:hypothetical protein
MEPTESGVVSRRVEGTSSRVRVARKIGEIESIEKRMLGENAQIYAKK